MRDPIEDYIRANREQYTRGAVTGRLLAAGHDRAAIKAAWSRLDQPGPEWNAATPTTAVLQMAKWTARRWTLVTWTVAVWVVGILWPMSASEGDSTVTGMFLAYAVFPVWLIGFGVLALLVRGPKAPKEPEAPMDLDAGHP